MKVFFAENLPPQQAIAMLRAYADNCRGVAAEHGPADALRITAS